MTAENPTGEQAGASISERLENYLAASEPSNDKPQAQETAPPKAGDAEPEESPETQTEQPAGDDAGEEDGPQISLSDVAALLGVEESALDIGEDGSVSVKTKIDGKEGAAKFVDLVKSYQVQGHVDAKAREAAETAKAMQDRVQQFEAWSQQESARLSNLAQVVQQELMGDAARIDWTALAQNDPAGYVAKQHEFQQRQARVNQILHEAQARQAQVAEIQQYTQQQAVSSLSGYLQSNIKGWSHGNEVDVELTSYAKSAGMNDPVSVLTSCPAVGVLLHKAMLYDKGQPKAELTEKKLRAAPKLVRPGQSISAAQRANESIRSLKENIRKSGGRSGIAELLMATGKV